MINLLPTDLKVSILYARRNTMLLKWVVLLTIVVVGIGAVILGGSFYMKQSISDYSDNVAALRQEPKLQKLEETQSQLESISGSIKLVVQVLSKQILFSKLIQQIGAAMPPNTVLTGLQIEKIQGSITLTAQATNVDNASQVQVNLQDPGNQIFEKADIESISCSGGQAGRYPCRVQIKALFGKNSQFYFITSKSTTSESQQ